MKTRLLLTIVFIGIILPEVYAQRDKLTLHLNNRPITEALNEIQKATGYSIIYSNDIVSDTMMVNLDATNKSITEILGGILTPKNLFYSQRPTNTIVIGSNTLRKQGVMLAYSYVKISGSVIDNDRQPLPFATIALLRKSNVLTNMACDEQGQYAFTFPMQNDSAYSLQISAIGYQTRSIKFVYPDTSRLKSIVLVRQTNTLKTVEVSTSKPMVERKVDRLVFNLQNSIAVKGADLSEALRLTPMLKVSENGVSIIGKGSVAIMINERIIHLDGNNLMSYLKSLQADDVEKIEVITTPPAKYEAQGNNGLVNIVLKKDPKLGWNGNIGASLIQSFYASTGSNINLNYQSNKLSVSLKLNDYISKSKIDEESNIVGAKSILNSYPRTSKGYSLGGNFSVDYKINSKSNIGAIYDIGKSDSKTLTNNTTIYQTNNVTDSILKTASVNIRPTFRQTLSIYHDQTLDSTGKKINSVFNYFTNAPTINNTFETISEQSLLKKNIKANNDVNFKVWSVQSDLKLPYEWSTLESGIKFTNFDNYADIKFLNLENNSYLLDSSKSNLLEYNEKNIAAYTSIQKDIYKKWTAKAGLRYEYSIINSYSPTVNLRVQSSYGNLFPTAYLLYKANPKNSFSISYSRRINRPYLNALNPFRFYTNPYSYSSGNPYLKPSYSHGIELSYLYKNMLSLTIYGRKTVGGWGPVYEIDNDYMISTIKNYLTSYSTGFSGTFNYKIYPWWETSNSTSFHLSNSKSQLPEILTQKGIGFNYSTYNTFKINSHLSAFASLSHSLPSRSGNNYTANQMEARVGFRIITLNDKLQINTSYFRGSINRYKIFYKDYMLQQFTDYKYNTFMLNFTYNFGKPKVSGNTKSINFSDKQRAN